MRRSYPSSYLLIGLVGLAATAFACTPSIGDKCVLSTDCSVNGDRLCDTSQPDGYCTVFNCVGDGCPDKAACVLFNAGIPGCGYNDRSGPNGSRVGRSFCVSQCQSNSDCRSGYVCADPRRPPWNALNMDDPQNTLTCLVKPDGWDDDGGVLASVPPPSNAPVCSSVAPDVPAIDASAPKIGSDGGKTDAGDGGI